MAAKIRLTRKGSKKRPYYWIVVADSRSPRDGSFIEKIGTYNPLATADDEKRLTLNIDRARHWVSVGAQPSDRVAKFLDRFHVRKSGLKFNPKQGVPKEKARERAEMKGARKTMAATIAPLDEDERAAAEKMIAMLAEA